MTLVYLYSSILCAISTRQISFAFSIMACLALLLQCYSNLILTIGSLLIRGNYVQYPVAFGGPLISTSANTYTCSSVIPSAQSPYRLRGVGFSERPCVSPWAGRSLYHVTPFTNRDTGSSIAEIVSAFPTCGGLRVSPATFQGVTLAHKDPVTGILHPRSSCQRGIGQL